MEQRDFKGVWIPKSVWLDTRLNALDKVILVEIDSLDEQEKGCYASNKYLADFCQCSESKVTKTISKLVELGYLHLASFDGRQRELRSSLSNYDKQSSKIYEADFQNLPQNNIDNNKDNNKVIIKEKIPKKEIDTEFESLWKRYPLKKSKESAYKSYAKARANGTTYDEVINGLENYLKEIEVKKTDKQYIKHGSTWFSQHCWQDEYVLENNSKNGNSETEKFNAGLMNFVNDDTDYETAVENDKTFVEIMGGE